MAVQLTCGFTLLCLIQPNGLSKCCLRMQIIADLMEQLSAAQEQNCTLTSRVAQLQQLMESQHRAAATQQKACTPTAKVHLSTALLPQLVTSM